MSLSASAVAAGYGGQVQTEGIIPEIGRKVNKKGLEKVVANWAGMVYNGRTAKRIAGKRCGVSGGVSN
jgi:hypothetical protein